MRKGVKTKIKKLKTFIQKYNREINKMDSEPSSIILKTHRFVLSKEITELLSEFSKIHQYDDRKTYKEIWEKWIKSDDIEPIINDEIK